jgi:hypothetical protein
VTPPHPELAAHGSFAHLKLGRKAVAADPRTLQLAKYLDRTQLPPIPATADFVSDVPAWPMYGNDQLGDCTCAAAGHMIEAWTYSAGTDKTPVEADVETMYWETGSPPAASGTPGSPADDGREEVQVLNYWRQTGLGGDTIGAYAAVDPTNHADMQAAVYLFGGVYLGVALPKTAQTQQVWDVVTHARHADTAPGSWGGHAVPCHAYDQSAMTVITWGAPLQATWAFNDKYVDEAYAIISNDILKGGGTTINGFNLSQLQADLAAIEKPSSS